MKLFWNIFFLFSVICLKNSFSQVVSLDSHTEVYPGKGNTSISWTHTTTTNSDRLFLLFATSAVTSGTANPITSAAYNNSLLTLLASAEFQPNTKSYMYYMLNPPSGVNTVSITVNSTDYISASSITYSNVDQTIPTYSVFGGYATAASFSINTLYQNNLLAGFFGSANNINGVSSGQTEIFNVGSASKSYCELSVKTSTSTLTSFGVTIAASADWEAVFIPIKPLNAVLLPIELTAFSGNYLDNKVQLKWSTATEKKQRLVYGRKK